MIGPEPRPAEVLNDLPPEIAAKLPAIASIKPLPQAAIPDDPPPHEGAMISIPIIIEPPSIIRLEVLEALPGRPITGERLVRPDGTINLGFYGDLEVRGLTLEQIKVKLILHLRRFVNDRTLGLISVESYPEPPGGDVEMPAVPRDGNPFVEPPKSGEAPPPTQKGPSGGFSREGRGKSAIRRVGRVQTKLTGPATGPKAPEVQVRGPLGGRPVNEQIVPAQPGPTFVRDGITYLMPAPESSDRVIVDVGAYNTTAYYVYGDVTSPGRLPTTGKETVLDALNYAGGLAASANPKDVRLVRPSRGDKPAKVYPIDLSAIIDRGDRLANLQVFPDDRIVVGRFAASNTAAAVDRAVAPLNAMTSSMISYAFALRSLANIDEPNAPGTTTNVRLRLGGFNVTVGLGPERPASGPERRTAALQAWNEVWKKAMQSGQPPVDLNGLGDEAMRHLLPKPEDAKPR